MKRTKLFPFVVLAVLMLLGTAEANAAPGSLLAYAGKTLHILMKTGYTSVAVTDFKEEFEKATGIKLDIEVLDEPTTEKKFVLDATSKTGAYDVVATEFWYMPEYLQLGGLEPLDNYITNNPSKWLSVKDMPEGLKDTYKGADGKLYSLPVTASGGVLMYRKDLFDKYGIAVPKTTEDVLKVAKILKQKLPAGIVPFIGRGDSSSASFGSPAGWAWAYGAAVMDAKGNVTVNSDKMKQAMTDWVSLMKDYGSKDASAMGWDTMSEVFRQGKAAMNIDMSGFPNVYMDPKQSQVNDKVGVVLVYGPDNKAAQWMYGEGIGTNKYSKNKDAAWLYVQWRTSLDTAEEEMAKGIRLDFPLNSIYATDVYKKVAKDNAFAQMLPDIMKSIDTTYWPNVPQFEKVASAFEQQISLAIAGQENVSTALANAEKNVSNALK